MLALTWKLGNWGDSFLTWIYKQQQKYQKVKILEGNKDTISYKDLQNEAFLVGRSLL